MLANYIVVFKEYSVCHTVCGYANYLNLKKYRGRDHKSKRL